ncbi:MAG: SLATT domain-containing protein [Chloroflexi bacterium]|nr:SLATT domain-containing protein [Chloroflexota bacterium]
MQFIQRFLFGSKKGEEDIPTPAIVTFDWSTDNLERSLERLYRQTIENAENAQEWYRDAKPGKKRMAQWLRYIAIIAAAVGGIIPIIAGTWDNISPGWSSIALAIAAAAVALDRFFGYSSAWMRFMLTSRQIGDRLKAFRYEWEAERIVWQAAGGLTPQETARLVRMLATFANEVNNMVTQETRQWAQEFQTALQDLESQLKMEAERRRTGALNVTVNNASQFENGWELYVDDRRVRRFTGLTGAVKDLLPRIYQVRVIASIDGREVQATRAADVIAGQISEVYMTVTGDVPPPTQTPTPTQPTPTTPAPTPSMPPPGTPSPADYPGHGDLPDDYIPPQESIPPGEIMG